MHGKAFHILGLMHETNVDLDIPKFDRNSNVLKKTFLNYWEQIKKCLLIKLIFILSIKMT